MGPRDVTGEVLEEQRGDDGLRALRAVVGVGDLGADFVLVAPKSGNRQNGSPAVSPAASSASASASLLAKIPPTCWPSATLMPPVSVATSTSTSGSTLSTAYAIASASTSRPSASVLVISLVRPP